MKREKLDFVGHDIKKMPGKLYGLLGITFRDTSGKEFTWWPRWDEVRLLYVLAMVTEWANEGPYKFDQTKKFVEHARGWADTMTDWVKQAIGKDKERLKRLIEQGNFRQATEILNSDLLKATDWLAGGRR